MPTSVVKTHEDELLWERAKRLVIDQYGASLEEENPKKFYALVMSIFLELKEGGR